MSKTDRDYVAIVKNKGAGAAGHAFTTDEQARGGGVMSLAKKLAHRKYCHQECPIYPCYVQPLRVQNDKSTNRRNRFWCALTRMDPRMKQRYMRLHTLGSEGLLEEMRDTLMQMKESIDPDRAVQDLASYFDRIENLAQRMYPQGTHVTVEHTGEVKHEHTITLTRIVEEFQIVEGKSEEVDDDEED